MSIFEKAMYVENFPTENKITHWVKVIFNGGQCPHVETVLDQAFEYHEAQREVDYTRDPYLFGFVKSATLVRGDSYQFEPQWVFYVGVGEYD